MTAQLPVQILDEVLLEVVERTHRRGAPWEDVDDDGEGPQESIFDAMVTLIGEDLSASTVAHQERSTPTMLGGAYSQRTLVFDPAVIARMASREGTLRRMIPYMSAFEGCAAVMTNMELYDAGMNVMEPTMAENTIQSPFVPPHADSSVATLQATDDDGVVGEEVVAADSHAVLAADTDTPNGASHYGNIFTSLMDGSLPMTLSDVVIDHYKHQDVRLGNDFGALVNANPNRYPRLVAMLCETDTQTDIVDQVRSLHSSRDDDDPTLRAERCMGVLLERDFGYSLNQAYRALQLWQAIEPLTTGMGWLAYSVGIGNSTGNIGDNPAEVLNQELRTVVTNTFEQPPEGSQEAAQFLYALQTLYRQKNADGFVRDLSSKVGDDDFDLRTEFVEHMRLLQYDPDVARGVIEAAEEYLTLFADDAVALGCARLREEVVYQQSTGDGTDEEATMELPIPTGVDNSSSFSMERWLALSQDALQHRLEKIMGSGIQEQDDEVDAKDADDDSTRQRRDAAAYTHWFKGLGSELPDRGKGVSGFVQRIFWFDRRRSKLRPTPESTEDSGLQTFVAFTGLAEALYDKRVEDEVRDATMHLFGTIVHNDDTVVEQRTQLKHLFAFEQYVAYQVATSHQEWRVALPALYQTLAQKTTSVAAAYGYSEKEAPFMLYVLAQEMQEERFVYAHLDPDAKRTILDILKNTWEEGPVRRCVDEEYDRLSLQPVSLTGSPNGEKLPRIYRALKETPRPTSCAESSEIFYLAPPPDDSIGTQFGDVRSGFATGGLGDDPRESFHDLPKLVASDRFVLDPDEYRDGDAVLILDDLTNISDGFKFIALTTSGQSDHDDGVSDSGLVTGSREPTKTARYVYKDAVDPGLVEGFRTRYKPDALRRVASRLAAVYRVEGKIALADSCDAQVDTIVKKIVPAKETAICVDNNLRKMFGYFLAVEPGLALVVREPGSRFDESVLVPFYKTLGEVVVNYARTRLFSLEGTRQATPDNIATCFHRTALDLAEERMIGEAAPLRNLQKAYHALKQQGSGDLGDLLDAAFEQQFRERYPFAHAIYQNTNNGDTYRTRASAAQYDLGTFWRMLRRNANGDQETRELVASLQRVGYGSHLDLGLLTTEGIMQYVRDAKSLLRGGAVGLALSAIPLTVIAIMAPYMPVSVAATLTGAFVVGSTVLGAAAGLLYKAHQRYNQTGKELIKLGDAARHAQRYIASIQSRQGREE